jgi:phosphoenolpyruvate phosphomutase
MKSDVVYVGMSADILHHGHINILQTASKLGPVVVGLLTDDAILSYKRIPVVSWEERKRVVASTKYVNIIIPQHSLDYSDNLKVLRPSYVVHGSDWKEGVQSDVRTEVIRLLAKWGGQLVEPEYTQGISTTSLIEKCKNK